jgi:hypothetical protein
MIDSGDEVGPRAHGWIEKNDTVIGKAELLFEPGLQQLAIRWTPLKTSHIEGEARNPGNLIPVRSPSDS